MATAVGNSAQQRAITLSGRPTTRWPVQGFNAISRRWPFKHWLDTPLCEKKLLAQARRKTRLHDFIFADTEEYLRCVIDSVNTEGKLTAFGKTAYGALIRQSLCNQLWITHCLDKYHSAIHVQKINKPIFITGWYRTGTTYLHNLLHQVPQLRAPLFWELRLPCPSQQPQQVNEQRCINQVQRAQRIHQYLAPEFQQAHPMAATEPEECLYLFENLAISSMAFFMTEATSYANWLLEQDLSAAYAHYHQQLQLLNWLRPGQRWLLKWPYHYWHSDALLRAFPDATIIHIERDPQQAVPSVCSLAALARAPFCTSIDYARLGEFWLRYNRTGQQRFAAARRNWEKNIISINYAELVQQPVKILQRIAQITELHIDAATLLQNYSSRTGQTSRSGQKHRYTAKQFGLDEDRIQKVLS